jgi:putative oxygen-independent coproporphyrinogen III oxidase
MNPSGTPASFGVYVHIPFCVHRCDYCAFATWTDRDHLIGRYLDALGNDIRRSVADGLPPASTLFVGGGTPSRVDPTVLAGVIGAIPIERGAEVTVECNPDDVTVPLLRAYLEAGVNRISLGVQSMVPHVLRALGRTHKPANVDRAVDCIGEVGFASFSLDLIYGAVGESVHDWETTLVGALALKPPHISAYGLTVEAGTPLAATPERHPDDDDQATKYEIADERLSASGLENYEISNWARPGDESKHNQLYWAQADYRGFGCAAHSHTAGRRWWNVRTPERYIEAVERGAPTEAAGESLDDETRRIEGLQLRVRTRDGVPADALDVDALPGLVERRGGNVVLTRSGRLLANEVSLRLK